jgi:hypothetical protein
VEVTREILEPVEDVRPDDEPWKLRVCLKGQNRLQEWVVEDGRAVYNFLSAVETQSQERFASINDGDGNWVVVNLERALFMEVPTELVDRGRALDELDKPVRTPYRRRPVMKDRAVLLRPEINSGGHE